MTAEIYFAAFALIQIICLILFFIVLIKSFTKGGALPGILGIITCGLVTFFWGWFKHKHAQITMIMMLWTFLTLAQWGLAFMFGASMALELKSILQQQGIDADFLEGVDKTASKKRTKLNKSGKKRINIGKKSTTKISPSGKTIPENKITDPYAQAVALWQNGKYTNPNQAVQYLNMAIKKNPNSAEAYNSRGNAYRELKQPQKAISDYNQALRINPKYVMAYNNRANINYDLKKYQLAMVDYSKAIDLNPTYNRAYLNRGLAYYQLEQNNLACKDFYKACELGDCDGQNWAKESGLCK